MLIKNSFTVKKLSELPYLDTTLDLESRTEDLLQRLTFEEKCLLIVGKEEGMEILRLQFPVLGFHGLKPRMDLMGSIPMRYLAKHAHIFRQLSNWLQHGIHRFCIKKGKH